MKYTVPAFFTPIGFQASDIRLPKLLHVENNNGVVCYHSIQKATRPWKLAGCMATSKTRGVAIFSSVFLNNGKPAFTVVE